MRQTHVVSAGIVGGSLVVAGLILGFAWASAGPPPQKPAPLLPTPIGMPDGPAPWHEHRAEKQDCEVGEPADRCEERRTGVYKHCKGGESASDCHDRMHQRYSRCGAYEATSECLARLNGEERAVRDRKEREEETKRQWEGQHPDDAPPAKAGVATE